MKKMAIPIKAEQHLGNSVKITRLWLSYGGNGRFRMVFNGEELYVYREDLQDAEKNALEGITCLKQA